MNFDAFVDDIVINKWNIYGVEVYESGKLIHSWGDTETNLHEIYSATKSVLSVAVGIFYDRGLIDFNKSILTYLPKERVDRLSGEQRTTFEKITVQRLLTMSVGGFPFRPEGEKWLDFSLNCKLDNPEKVAFEYSNIPVYLIGVALSNILLKAEQEGRLADIKCNGRSVDGADCDAEHYNGDLGLFIEKNILVPLEIDRYEYGRCPEGYFYGASGMKLTVGGLSRLGLLFYNKGCYKGRRIVSEKYIDMATSIQQMNREGGYGYYVWKYRTGYRISGKLNQKCYVLPDRGLMVTYLANMEGNTSELKESMERNIFGVID